MEFTLVTLQVLHQPHGEAPLVIGETTDGKPKAFLLERDGVQYFPVFRSAESMKEFYEHRNRAAYLVIEGDIKAVMDTISSIELMKDVRIVIDPMGEHPVETMPDA